MWMLLTCEVDSPPCHYKLRAGVIHLDLARNFGANVIALGIPPLAPKRIEPRGRQRTNAGNYTSLQ